MSDESVGATECFVANVAAIFLRVRRSIGTCRVWQLSVLSLLQVLFVVSMIVSGVRPFRFWHFIFRQISLPTVPFVAGQPLPPRTPSAKALALPLPPLRFHFPILTNFRTSSKPSPQQRSPGTLLCWQALRRLCCWSELTAVKLIVGNNKKS